MLRDSLLTGVKLWGVRRVQARTIAGAAAAAAVVFVAALLGTWLSLVVIVVAVTVATAMTTRHLSEPSPVYEPAGDGWAFAGERIAYRPVSEVLEHQPREIVDRLAARYGPDRMVEMVLWIVATDGTGQPWTLVQDRFGYAVPSVTATAVGLVPGACDPYLEAQRLSLGEIGVALVDVMVVGWGTDTSLDTRRDAIVVVGHASVGADKLGTHIYEGGGRRSHLVELHPDSVARSLTSVDARRWQAASLRGLVRCLETLYPGSGALLEELVTEPWTSRRMFGRLGRLTAGPAEQTQPMSEPIEDLVVHPVVLKVVEGGITEKAEVRPPVRHDRALSWERTPRTVPTRYGA